MELSFWERNSFIGKPDLAVIGSGIVGLNAAITFKKLNPSAHVIVLERGWLPWGASTKNAGFACFGSPTELLSDFESMQEKNVLDTVVMRLAGLKKLRTRLGDKNIGFIPCGGHEVFEAKVNYESCADQLTWLNQQLKSFTRRKETFEISNRLPAKMGMNRIREASRQKNGRGPSAAKTRVLSQLGTLENFIIRPVGGSWVPQGRGG